MEHPTIIQKEIMPKPNFSSAGQQSRGKMLEMQVFKEAPQTQDGQMKVTGVKALQEITSSKHPLRKTLPQKVPQMAQTEVIAGFPHTAKPMSDGQKSLDRQLCPPKEIHTAFAGAKNLEIISTGTILETQKESEMKVHRNPRGCDQVEVGGLEQFWQDLDEILKTQFWTMRCFQIFLKMKTRKIS